jgi:DNA-binding cell septation regulator SpoVG
MNEVKNVGDIKFVTLYRQEQALNNIMTILSPVIHTTVNKLCDATTKKYNAMRADDRKKKSKIMVFQEQVAEYGKGINKEEEYKESMGILEPQDKDLLEKLFFEYFKCFIFTYNCRISVKQIGSLIPPNTEIYYTCLIETLRELWNKAYLYDDSGLSDIDKQKNLNKMRELIMNSIKEGLRKVVPLNLLLNDTADDIFEDITTGLSKKQRRKLIELLQQESSSSEEDSSDSSEEDSSEEDSSEEGSSDSEEGSSEEGSSDSEEDSSEEGSSEEESSEEEGEIKGGENFDEMKEKLQDLDNLVPPQVAEVPIVANPLENLVPEPPKQVQFTEPLVALEPQQIAGAPMPQPPIVEPPPVVTEQQPPTEQLSHMVISTAPKETKSEKKHRRRRHQRKYSSSDDSEEEKEKIERRNARKEKKAAQQQEVTTNQAEAPTVAQPANPAKKKLLI